MIFDRFPWRVQLLADLVALWLSLLLAAYFAGPALEGVRFLRVLEWRISLGNLALVAALSLLWLFLIHLIDDSPTNQPIRWQPIAAVTVAGTALLALAALLFSLKLITPRFLAIFAVAYFLLDWGLRWIHLRVFAFLDPEQHHRIHTVVVGNHPAVQPVIERLRHSPRHRLLAHFCTELTTAESEPVASCDETPLNRCLQEEIVDQIILALPLSAISPPLHHLLREAQWQGIEVVVPLPLLTEVLPLPEPLGPRSHLVRMMVNAPSPHGVVPLLSFESGPQMGWALLAKRAIDLTGAVVGLLLLAPLMAGIALAIRITMGSPVLFIQPRMGFHRRVFPLFKFRTMIPNADALREALRAHNERDGAAFKMRNDPRITPLGRWLRRLNLDELPQLFNILRGEMSLVGPRPLPLDDYAHMDRTTYLRRLSVLPGITCTWQISQRSKVTFEEWMQMDLDYIDNWSLKRDLKLLAQTVWVVLRGRGDE
jgi:exopolysaccharide biosynthesis polyprenyl glycosylphosphotransferase